MFRKTDPSRKAILTLLLIFCGIITLAITALSLHSGGLSPATDAMASAVDAFAPADALPASSPVETALLLPSGDGPNPWDIPRTPPDASLITVGSPDVDGQATITGADGAVPPASGVAIINLSSGTLITATATAVGAFNATTFAPPGSALLIKYDPSGEFVNLLWQEAQNGANDVTYFTALPGTTIHVGAPAPGTGQYLDTGFFGNFEGLEWAGWWLSGTVSGPGSAGDLDIQPGDQITITGSLRVTSPALNCSGSPSFTPSAEVHIRYVFDEQGRNHPWGMWFVSNLFTPTGLPIEHEAGGEVIQIASTALSGMSCLSQHTAEGTITVTATVPGHFPPGMYRPELFLHDNGVPTTTDLPRVLVWYNFDPIAHLPLLRLGDPSPPKIPWTLFGNELSNGHRGVSAREDEGDYTMLTRIVHPPKRTVVPMFDERTGEPVTYQLEPGSLWISSNDRRMPGPPFIPLVLPGGELMVEVLKPDGSVDQVGPAPIKQSLVRTPTTPGGHPIDEGTGHVGDIYHLYGGDGTFAYEFDQYGEHTIFVTGFVEDVYGNFYPITSTYDLLIARILDLDPAQLPTTPYVVGDHFAPGLHVFPPVPADVSVRLIHMPLSDPTQAITTPVTGQANEYGYFQPVPGLAIPFAERGEFRVDISAVYTATDGTLWAGHTTWGNVVEGSAPLIEAHGRRGMDVEGDLDPNNPPPPWFNVNTVPSQYLGKEIYYPYFRGDVHWGDETEGVSPGDSIHPAVTLKDLTGPSETIYDLMRSHFPRARNRYRWPPVDWSLAGLEKRLDVHEAPLFITTQSGVDPAVNPEEVDMWGYWYGSSERPDVHVREMISEDGHGTGYWRFNDTYGYQIGEPADGDHQDDLKWEFGGVVFRVPGQGINEYAIYSSLWVLLPQNDPVGARVAPPFQDATGASFNGGPIMTLLGEEIDVLFLPKGVRPGDVLEVGDTISFSGHVGPPLDSRVDVTITAPGGTQHAATLRANKVGWVYDPTFDFVASEPGRWTVAVAVEHDRAYPGNGTTPLTHNTGTVLGTNIPPTPGQYEFYVVEASAPRLVIFNPKPGFIAWPQDGITPIPIQGQALPGTTEVYFTVHDKGVVMSQGVISPDQAGYFSLIYDADQLNTLFPMLSLTAREGRWRGLADEVAIHFLAMTPAGPQAATVTLIGEEVFLQGTDPGLARVYLPGVIRGTLP